MYLLIRKIMRYKRKYVWCLFSYAVGGLLPLLCLANMGYLEDSLEDYLLPYDDGVIKASWASSADMIQLFLPIVDEHINVKVRDKLDRHDNHSVLIQATEGELSNMECKIDSYTAENYNLHKKDQLIIRGSEFTVIEVLDDSKIANLVEVSLHAFEEMYYHGSDIQFTGYFNNESIDMVTASLFQVDTALTLYDVESVGDINERSRRDVQSWISSRLLIATAFYVIFLTNQFLNILYRLEEEKQVYGIKLALGAKKVQLLFHILCETMLITISAFAISCGLAYVGIERLELKYMLILDASTIVYGLILALVVSIGITFILGRRILKYSVRELLQSEEVL